MVLFLNYYIGIILVDQMIPNWFHLPSVMFFVIVLKGNIVFLWEGLRALYFLGYRRKILSLFEYGWRSNSVRSVNSGHTYLPRSGPVGRNVGPNTFYVVFRSKDQGPVVRKPINANPRLKINQGVYFSTPKCCTTLIFCKILH